MSVKDAVREHLERDAANALRAAKIAEAELRRGSDEQSEPNWVIDRRGGLSLILSQGFFAKVEATIESRDNERITFLITEARDGAFLDLENGAIVVSWTAKAPSTLKNTPPGEQARVEINKKVTTYKVLTTADYGHVLPKITRATYTFEGSTAFVEDSEEYLAGLEVPATDSDVIQTKMDGREHADYVAATSFGLQHIIRHKTEDQSNALYIPLDMDVIIEGPPGSGKTTIGIMRIPRLIDQQWRELGLARGADEGRFKAEWTQMLVLNREMVPYLHDLIRSMSVEGAKVNTFEHFFTQIARDCRTLVGRSAEEPIVLSILKGDPSFLPVLVAGVQAHVKEIVNVTVPMMRRKAIMEVAMHAAVSSFPENIASVPWDIRPYVIELRERNPWNESDFGSESENKSLALDRLRNAIAAAISGGDRSPEHWRQFIQLASKAADSILTRIEAWAASIIETDAQSVKSGGLPAKCNLAVALNSWAHRERADSLSERDTTKNATRFVVYRGATVFMRHVFQEVMPALPRLRQIVSTPEYGNFINDAANIFQFTPESIEDADRFWRARLTSNAKHSMYSEQDAMLAAWLGSYLGMTEEGTPYAAVVGYKKEKVSHIFIDEAQDLSPMHGRAIRRFLAHSGVITAVGDMHQRITEGRGLKSWADLELRKPEQHGFLTNHRQSEALGRFILSLHKELYGQSLAWQAGTRRGARPRIRFVRNDDDLANVVGHEVALIRHKIHRATIGVLYHEEDDRFASMEKCDNFSSELASNLAEEVVTVVPVSRRGDTGQVMATDRVLIVAISQTKGLEFDAVIHIAHGEIFETKDPRSCALVARNRVYVALSRAKQMLSIVVSPDSRLVRRLLNAGVCESAE